MALAPQVTARVVAARPNIGLLGYAAGPAAHVVLGDRAYDGRVSAFFPDFSETHLTRVQFIIGRNSGTGHPICRRLPRAVAVRHRPGPTSRA
jgi:hypothetical protein